MKYSNVYGIHRRNLFSSNSPNSYLTKAVLFLLLIFSASFLKAQPVCVSPFPEMCMNSNPIVFDDTFPEADVSSLECNGTSSTSITVGAGGLYRITIADNNSYTFTLTPSGNNTSSPIFPGVMNLFHDQGQTSFAASSGPISPLAGLTPHVLYYTDDPNPTVDNVLYLAVWDKSCAGNWKDYTLTISCTTCMIDSESRILVTASQDGCLSAASSFAAPTTTGLCNVNSIQIADPDGTGASFSSDRTRIELDPDLAVGKYTITFSLENCMGGSVMSSSTTEVWVEPNSGCQSINTNLSAACTTQITPSMVLTNQCLPDDQYTVYIDNVMTNITNTAGPHVVSVNYTPTDVNGDPDLTNPFYNKQLCWQNVLVEDKTGPECTLSEEDTEFNFVCGFEGEIAEPEFSDCSGNIIPNTVSEIVIGDCGELPGVLNGNNNLLDDFDPITEVLLTNGFSIPLPDEAEVALLTNNNFELENIRIRTYSATDGTTLGSTCTQFIYMWRPTDIRTPLKALLTCGSAVSIDDLAGYDPKLVPHYFNPLYDLNMDNITMDDFSQNNIADQLFVSTRVDDNGNPEFVSLVDNGNTVCNYNLTNTDGSVNVPCGNTMYFTRSYSVIDWCRRAVVLQTTQIVETVDVTPPTITNCPSDSDLGGISSPMEFALDDMCNAQFLFSSLGLTAEEDCGIIQEFKVEYFSVDDDFTSNETMVGSGDAFDFPKKGNYIARVVAVSECSTPVNVLESMPCNIYLRVLDTTSPSIIFPHPKVGMDNTGLAELCAANIAEAMDNCGTVSSFTIRNVNAANSTFAMCINISCDDIVMSTDNIAQIMVELRAEDDCENVKLLMCPVTIDINTRPEITCPTDVTLSCFSDYSQTTNYGDATLTGICNTAFSIVSSDAPFMQDGCSNSGYVVRTFSVFLNGVELDPVESCPQRITIFDDEAPVFVESPLPTNMTVDCDAIPDAVTLTATDNCATIDVDFNETQTDIAPGACPNEYVLTRTWTADDGCGNSIVHTQEITVENKALTVNDFSFTQSTTQECDDFDGFVFERPVIDTDFGCDVSTVMISDPVLGDPIDVNGNRTQVVTFMVTDACSTVPLEISRMFTFMNCCTMLVGLEMGPSCLPGTTNGTIGIVLPPLLNTLTLGDLLFTATNNADPSDIHLSTDNADPSNIIFDRSSSVLSFTVVVSARDPSIVLCPIDDFEVICGSSGRIAGRVFNEEFESIEDVEVELMNTEIPMSMTDIDGEYTFEDLESQEYTVAAHKENDPANGISTFDLVVMAQHVLGINPLSTPYKLIAADVNMDEEIDILDLIELRELILYTIQDFTVNDSWRFIDAEYEFPDPRNPWLETIPSSHTMDLGTEDAVVDFIAVKIGDLDCSAQTKSNFNSLEERSNKKMVLNALNQTVKAGISFDVVLNPSSDITLSSAQFTLHFDASMADFSGITSESLELKNSFSEMYMEEGLVPFAWYTHKAKDLDVDTDLVFTFTAKQDLSVSELFTIDSELTPALAYTPNGTQYDVQLNILDTNLDVNQSIVLHQNKPNPFADASIIGFELPNEQTVSITIFDIDGKLLYSKDVEGTVGYNQVELTADEISKTGVLFYQLNTDDYSVTKKMIILE